MQKKIEKYFNYVYKHKIPKKLKKESHTGDLYKVAKKLFGDKFVGVFPSDVIVELKYNQSAIQNLDKSDEPGSHWVAIYKGKKYHYFYDSFGREYEALFEKKYRIPNVKNTEDDAEQKISEDSCGAYAMAWLYVVYKKGIKQALLI